MKYETNNKSAKKLKREIISVIALILAWTLFLLWNFTGFLGKPHTVFLESDDSIEAFNPNEITIVKIEPGVKRFAYEKYILQFCDNIEEIQAFNFNPKKIYKNINFLKNKTHLKKLEIDWDCEDWSELYNMTSLEEILFYNTNFDDISLLSNCSNLRTISISRYHHRDDYSKLNSADFAKILNNFKNLEKFELRSYTIDSEFLKQLNSVDKQTEIDICYCKYEGDEYEAISLLNDFINRGYTLEIRDSYLYMYIPAEEK